MAPPLAPLTSLTAYTAINCSVPTWGRLGPLCCLAAGGAWLDAARWCALDHPCSAQLLAWSQCLSRAAFDDDTLAALLVGAGHGCAAAPGAVTVRWESFARRVATAVWAVDTLFPVGALAAVFLFILFLAAYDAAEEYSVTAVKKQLKPSRWFPKLWRRRE